MRQRKLWLKLITTLVVIGIITWQEWQKPTQFTTETPPSSDLVVLLSPTPPVILGASDSAIATSSSLFRVVRVADGDTFTVEKDGVTKTVRLIGVDTPETVDPRKPVQCYGTEASNFLKSLLIDQQVLLVGDPSQQDQDRYQRWLRYVYLPDGRLVNHLIISEGYGYEYTYQTPYQLQTEFKTAQELAKTNQKGLWSAQNCSN